jgi:hypothetical protein
MRTTLQGDREMQRRLALALSLFATALFGADAMGTWKLNTAKSKYTGMAAPKELTVVYSPQGQGWNYKATGVAATGQPIASSFTYVKDGAEIKTTGFPNWDGLVLQGAVNNTKSTGVMKRQGKDVGKLTRTMSADGKSMTIRGNLTLPDGKPATYVSVYDRQ